MFIRDSTGNKSLTATITVVGFVVVMVKLLLSGGSVALGGSTYSFGTIDAAMIAAVLTPILGSYTARRWGSPAPSETPVSTGTDTDGADDSAGSK